MTASPSSSPTSSPCFLPTPSASSDEATRATVGVRLARDLLVGLVVIGLVLAAAACSRETAVSSGPGSTTGTTPGTVARQTPGSPPTSTPTSLPTSLPTSTPGSMPGSPPTSTPRSTTTFVASPPPVPAASQDGAVYLALVRHSLDRTKLDPPRSTKPYAEIVIVDHGVGDAAEPGAIGSAAADGPPFTQAVRDDLANGLGDLGPVRFVPDAKAGAVTSQPGHERVLVVVGPIEEVGADGTTVHVGLSKTCGPMCGSGGTSVLERRGGQWVVTGATGGGWIS